jgi:hypothetical protein
MTSLGAPRRWKSEAARSGLQGGWGRTANQKFFLIIPLFSAFCLVVRCPTEGGLQQYCTRSKSPTKLLQNLWVWLYRSEFVVWPHGTYTKITPYVFQKQWLWRPLLKGWPWTPSSEGNLFYDIPPTLSMSAVQNDGFLLNP